MQPGLALVAITDDSLMALLRIGVRMLSGRGVAGAGVQVLNVAEATLSSATDAAAQVDGDPFGVTPVHARAAEFPVRLIVNG